MDGPKVFVGFMGRCRPIEVARDHRRDRVARGQHQQDGGDVVHGLRAGMGPVSPCSHASASRSSLVICRPLNRKGVQQCWVGESCGSSVSQVDCRQPPTCDGGLAAVAAAPHAEQLKDLVR